MKTKIVKSKLEPLIKACQKQRGLKSEVLRQMIMRKETATWGMLSEWLHPKPENRRVPREGKMRALLDIQNGILKNKQINQATKKPTAPTAQAGRKL